MYSMQAPPMSAAEEQRKTLRQRANEAYAAPYAHPVEAIQKDWLQRQLAARDVAWGNAYGMALPTRLKLEREILQMLAGSAGNILDDAGNPKETPMDPTQAIADYIEKEKKTQLLRDEAQKADPNFT